MSEATIYETRNNFSAIIDDLVVGRTKEHVVKNRNKPVVRIVAVADEKPKVLIGSAKDIPFLASDDALDRHNDEIAALFGV